jgi:hypothetical protein
MNGSFTSVPKLVSLLATGLEHLLVPLGAREVGVGRVERVLATPGVDQRAMAVHVLLALREAPAVPSRAPLLGRIRTVELGDDGLRDGDVDPAQLVDQLLELAEVDNGDVVDRQPGQLPDGQHGQARPAELHRRIDLRLSVARDVDDQVARDREICDAGGGSCRRGRG